MYMSSCISVLLNKTKSISNQVIIIISRFLIGLTLLVNEIIGDDQSGFRRNRLTVCKAFEVYISVNFLNIVDQYISCLWILRKPVAGSGEKHFVTF